MADGKLRQFLYSAEGRLRHWRELRRRRPSVKKGWKLALQVLLLVILTTLGIAVYFKLSSDKTRMHWGFALAGMIASAVGVVFSLMAAWRSSVADKRTELLLDKLQETQRIVGESPSDYLDVFDLHLLRPMQRANNPLDKDDHLRRMDLHISTPAYGYHVLGFGPHLDFRNLLGALQCDKQIIVFSPDAHFFHVANALIWHPLKRPGTSEAAAGITTGVLQLDEFSKDEDPDVDPKVLAECIIATLDELRQQVLKTEENIRRTGSGEYRNMRVGVWTSNTTEFRLTAFRFQTETLAYLLLTDQVTLASDLSSFRGRALSLPMSIHRQVIGDPGDRESFFEQLKTCPYSQEPGSAARLLSNEFEPLKYDYLFLRTGHSFIDLYLFNIQCRNVIWAVKKPKGESERIAAAREILNGVVEYFHFLKTKPIAQQYVPSNSIQQERLSKVEPVLELLKDTTVDVKVILRTLVEGQLHYKDPFPRELEEYEEHIKNLGPDFIDLSNWMACIYYFISSGFHQSLHATARWERAQHMRSLSNPEADRADASPIPITELTSGSDGQPELLLDSQSINKRMVLEIDSATPGDHSSNEPLRQEEATVNAIQNSNPSETEDDSNDESPTVDS